MGLGFWAEGLGLRNKSGRHLIYQHPAIVWSKEIVTVECTVGVAMPKWQLFFAYVEHEAVDRSEPQFLSCDESSILLLKHGQPCVSPSSRVFFEDKSLLVQQWQCWRAVRATVVGGKPTSRPRFPKPAQQAFWLQCGTCCALVYLAMCSG